jgi:hypothetical protein
MDKKSLLPGLFVLAGLSVTLEVHALALEAFCNWPETLKTVERMAKKLNYGPGPTKTPPNVILFHRAEFNPYYSCVYSFAYANIIDFGFYRAIVAEEANFRLRVKRIEFIHEWRLPPIEEGEN